MVDLKLNHPEEKELLQYMRNNPRRADLTLKLMAGVSSFVDVWKTKIGQQILTDDVLRHDVLLEKIYNESASEQEKAEFRYLKRRLKNISERIAEFNRMSDKIKNG